MIEHPSIKDPRFHGALDLLGASGAASVGIRYSDDEQPVVWMAVVTWRVDPATGKPVSESEAAEVGAQLGGDAAAALDPRSALFRLCEQVFDGVNSKCVHCQRPAGFAEDFDLPMPLSNIVCWRQWDPEVKVFRRSCEGDYTAPGRNDPCPCESGLKFKKCHGA